MKLQYPIILLFSLSLNILAHSKNKTYITLRHIPTTTSRVLSECHIDTSIYDNDPEMKSVKKNFNKQTSQRFEEYNKGIIKKRQKCKEQCQKDIQQIIMKDKTQKSLAQKVEKGCLICGCGLGVFATSVGLIGTLTVNELKKTAMAAAIVAAKDAAKIEGAAKGAAKGAAEVVKLIESTFGVKNIAGQELGLVFTAQKYNNIPLISGSIINEYYGSKCLILGSGGENPICEAVTKLSLSPGYLKEQGSAHVVIGAKVKEIVSQATEVSVEVTRTATKEATSVAIKTKTSAVEATYASCQTAIIASVVALVVISLVMVIIYLILRYRRKRKMNKKLQYTKLLNQ
ncbi:PIR protein, putative [Plasmodium sp.]|nr:PIR protein, putative [Plasmodium sp.]